MSNYQKTDEEINLSKNLRINQNKFKNKIKLNQKL